MIGQFHFSERKLPMDTPDPMSMELITRLLLEEFSVVASHTNVTDSLMKAIKMSSQPGPKDQPINNNSFGRVNKKFCRIFINFLSLQLVFDNWYVPICIVV